MLKTQRIMYYDSERFQTRRYSDYKRQFVLTSLGSAAIGAGLNVAGNLFGMANQNSVNKTNIQLQREQNEWNEKMWRLNNEYNTPVNQVQRLKDAGLNVGLMYSNGQGDVGNSSSPANTTAPAKIDSLGNPMTGVTSSVAQILDALSNQANAETNRMGALSQIELNTIIGKKHRYEFETYMPKMLNLQQAEVDAKIRKLDTETSFLQLQKENFVKELDAKINLWKSQGKLSDRQADYYQKMINWYDKYQAALIYATYQAGNRDRAQAELNKVMAVGYDLANEITATFGYDKEFSSIGKSFTDTLTNVKNFNNVELGILGKGNLGDIFGKYSDAFYNFMNGYNPFSGRRLVGYSNLPPSPAPTNSNTNNNTNKPAKSGNSSKQSSSKKRKYDKYDEFPNGRPENLRY